MHHLKTMLSPTLRCACSQPTSLLTPKSTFSTSSSLNHPQWSGLHSWRYGPLNHNRLWGPNGPQPPPPSSVEPDDAPLEVGSSLAEMGAVVLNTADPLTKSKLSHLAYSRWRQENLAIGVCEPPLQPARPPKPQLVSFLYDFYSHWLIYVLCRGWKWFCSNGSIEIWLLMLWGWKCEMGLSSCGVYVVVT